MKFSDSVFKAYDIRGLSGTELTPELAEAVGRAVADYLPQAGPVVVGRDMRSDSAELAEAVVAGLTRQGRDVWDIGLVTTDMIYFGAGHFDEVAGGVMVTASHNPGKYNGIKLCGHDALPMGAEHGLLDIRELVRDDRYAEVEQPGHVTQRPIIDEWVEQVLKFVGQAELPAYKVAVDAGNGMAGAIFPALAAKLPWVITPLYFELDSTFPNHVANPHLHETLAEIIKTIKANGLDFGLAFDGDGDRGALIDETGTPVPEAITGAILVDHYLQKYPGATVVYDVRTSRIVRDTIVAHGGVPLRSKVGGDDIKGLMRGCEAVLGIEATGHYYFRDNYYSDSGLISVMTAVGVMARTGKKLSELAAPYRMYATGDEINLPVKDTAAELTALKQAYADGGQDELDGLSVNYPTWWFNVRPSNTEPLLRLNIEASTPELLVAKTAELLGRLQKN